MADGKMALRKIGDAENRWLRGSLKLTLASFVELMFDYSEAE